MQQIGVTGPFRDIRNFSSAVPEIELLYVNVTMLFAIGCYGSKTAVRYTFAMYRNEWPFSRRLSGLPMHACYFTFEYLMIFYLLTFTFFSNDYLTFKFIN